MSDVVALMPFEAAEDWRRRAQAFTVGWYGRHFPGLRLELGRCSGEWSKGAAVADAVERAGSARVYVLADADSFLADPAELRSAIELVRAGAPWIVPHDSVYRLRPAETERLHAEPTAKPRLGHTHRPVYFGIAGGGITVVAREAFELVGGIDRRFLGWGGEDVAFGYALETLAGPVRRLEGRLVHLWHPPATENLRGSEESERLVGAYTAAHGYPRRMRDVIETGEHPQPLPPLPDPVRFRMKARDRHRIKIGGHWHGPFTNGTYETDDPDYVEALRRDPRVQEVTR